MKLIVILCVIFYCVIAQGTVTTERIVTTEGTVTTTEICCPSPAILPEPGVCGVAPIYNRSIGETFRVTVIDDHPWMVLLEYTRYVNNYKIYNNVGVLITQRYVLTACNCEHTFRLSWTISGVRLGLWYSNAVPDCETNESGDQDCPPPPLDIKVIEIITHEQYNPQLKNEENNIALLKLQIDVTFSKFVKPICLPKTEHLKSMNHVGNTLFVSGWGYIENVKQVVTTDVIHFTRCQDMYNRLNITISSTQICTESIRGSIGNLFGSPLMTVDTTTGTTYLVGILSIDYDYEDLSSMANINLPTIYTRVSSYITWIESKLNMEW